jgi:cysteine desulfurase / selenocysteine lyase
VSPVASAAVAPRADFPLLEELTYLNTASVGLVPLPVQREAHEFDREIASRGTTWFDERQETLVLERARAAAARLLTAQPECVAIVSSATEMLCQLAWRLAPAAGENVVSVDLEFPTVTHPWQRVAEDTGAEVRLVPAMADPGSFGIETLAELVDDRTAVICVSQVQYANGARLELDELTALARAHDARLVVDASQSAGAVPIDVARSGVDALVTTGYKWLGGPFGAAVAYVSPELLDGFRPTLVGWRGTPEPYALDARELRLAADARRFEFSTMSYTAAQALGAAIEYVLELGVETILQHDLGLTGRLIEGLDALGAELITPRDDAARAGIVSARFPGRDTEQVVARLGAAGVVVSARLGCTRFSTHFFNSANDMDAALDALKAALKGGLRA